MEGRGPMAGPAMAFDGGPVNVDVNDLLEKHRWFVYGVGLALACWAVSYLWPVVYDGIEPLLLGAMVGAFIQYGRDRAYQRGLRDGRDGGE